MHVSHTAAEPTLTITARQSEWMVVIMALGDMTQASHYEGTTYAAEAQRIKDEIQAYREAHGLTKGL